MNEPTNAPEMTPHQKFLHAYYNDPTVNAMWKQGAGLEEIVAALACDKVRLQADLLLVLSQSPKVYTFTPNPEIVRAIKGEK